MLLPFLLCHAAFAQLDDQLLKAMQYRLIGPFRGGRVLTVASIPGDPQTYYFGAASGGVWKSVDGGAHWSPTFDHEDIASIGSIAVAPSDPNILYVGTGEGCLRGNISYGNGVYRSNDGGKTWKNLGLGDSRHIPKVLIDPRNPDIALVAAGAGLNRFYWNLRYEDPITVPGAFYETDIPPKGPMALPGSYQVRLTAGGQSRTAPLELRKDPRINASTADLEAQFELERQLSRRLTSLHNTVNEIRDLRAQVNALSQRYKNVEAWVPLKPLADELLKKISAVEEKIIQTKMKSTEGDLRYPTMLDEQLIFLNWSVDAADSAPTDGQQKLFADLSAKLQEQLNLWDRILSTDLAGFNRSAEKQKLMLVDVRSQK